MFQRKFKTWEWLSPMLICPLVRPRPYESLPIPNFSAEKKKKKPISYNTIYGNHLFNIRGLSFKILFCDDHTERTKQGFQYRPLRSGGFKNLS